MRYEFIQELINNIDNVSWEKIIDLGNALEFKIKSDEQQLLQLKKELNATKIILSERLKYSTNTGNFEPKLMMDILSLIEKTEALSTQYNVDLQHFQLYLRLVLEKLKREKLVVKRFPDQKGFDNKKPELESLDPK
ncbi:MAG: hypothetical protein N3E37_02420 [Candidatus Micrarchaeota archaeon]|nr:hypothetical protein [Candidatus Micrarchaeota archaeon]